MTRQEWIEELMRDESFTYYVAYSQRVELAALLRESATPISESDYKTLRHVRDVVAGALSVGDVTDFDIVLDRLEPPLKVEWIDVGCNSVAEVAWHSLLVRCWQNQFQAVIANHSWSSQWFDGRDAAKAAAEACLRELLREGK